jgi:hypothetical protein
MFQPAPCSTLRCHAESQLTMITDINSEDRLIQKTFTAARG